MTRGLLLPLAAAGVLLAAGCVQSPVGPTPTPTPPTPAPSAAPSGSGTAAGAPAGEQAGGAPGTGPTSAAPVLPDGTPTSPPQLVAAMESAAVARGSARFDMSGSLGGAGLASVTGGYVFHSAEEIDFTTTVEFRDGGTTRTARAVGLGNAVYLRPPTRDGMPPGTEWIRRARSDWEDPPEVTPVYNEAIRSINGIRDWSMIAAAAELVPVGTRTVDGERTTGYRARFEVLAAMRTEGVVGASFRVLQDLYAQGARTVGFIVWVDGGYLPRSVLVSVPTDEGRLMAELNFHGWGEPVAPEAPPDELVWRRS